MHKTNNMDLNKNNMKQTIEIEKGRTVKNIEVSDGKVVINYEEAFCPKDGDFVAGEYDGRKYISICKSKKSDAKFYYHVISNGDKVFAHNDWADSLFCTRMQTESEKQQLLDALAKEGLTWNAEKKVVEKRRWRVNERGEYFFINSEGSVVKSTEILHGVDNGRFNLGNYFITNEDAQKAADGLKEYFAQYK